MKRKLKLGITLLESMISMAIIIIVLAALVPQLRCIQNTWASKQGTSELLQNGRVFMEHITANLEQCSTINAVSIPGNSNGFIELVDNDGNTMRYEMANNTIRFGALDDLSDLADSATELKFTCYDAYNFTTPVTDANTIRLVQVSATFMDPQNSSITQTYSNQVYIRSNLVTKKGTVGHKYIFDYFSDRSPDVIKIDSTHYLCAFHDYWSTGCAQILTIDTLTDTIDSSMVYIFDSSAGKYPALAQIDATHFLLAYEGPDYDGWAVILTINPLNWTITKGTPFEFDSYNGEQVSLAPIDATRFLCVYRGYNGDGYAVILTVSTALGKVTKGTNFCFDATRGYNPALIKIDNGHILCTYRGESDDGWAAVLAPNLATGTITKTSSFEFDSVKCDWPSVEAIDATRFLCCYTGESDDGYAVILTINPSTYAMSKGSTFEFDKNNGKYPAVSKVDSRYFLCAYQSSLTHGWAQLLNVNTETGKVSKEATLIYDNTRAVYPALSHIDGYKFLCCYQGRYDFATAVLLDVDLQILP